VLNLIGLRRDLVLPSLSGVDLVAAGSLLHRCVSCGGQEVVPLSQGGFASTGGWVGEEDMLVLREVTETLQAPCVGEMLRQGHLAPAVLVEIRESDAGRAFRKWYAENAAEDPARAACEARELIASRTRGSIGARVVDFLLGRLVSRVVDIWALSRGVPPVLGLLVDDLTTMLHSWLGRSVGKLLCDRDHPLTIVERLRRDGNRKGPS
jgi:hypothetical protein